MDIQEARVIEAVRGAIVDVKPLIDPDGVAIVPYGVTAISEKAIGFGLELRVLALPETVEVVGAAKS